jgi:hypothetical protein
MFNFFKSCAKHLVCVAFKLCKFTIDAVHVAVFAGAYVTTQL